MNKLQYAEYRQTDDWKALRLDVIERAGYRCVLCASLERLQIHHNTYVNIGNEDLLDLTCLCRACHQRYHEGENEDE